MPFSKRTYSFRQSASDDAENNESGLSTPLRKIKSRGRTFIGGKTPTTDSRQDESGSLPSPFTRGSVRLRSIRKRKMANRDDVKNEQASFKREKLLDKQKDEIEMKIEENIRMKDGITKLLGGCHDIRQAMDIGKNLLTINSRMLSLMSSLQKKRSSNILKDLNKGQGAHEKTFEPCVGDLAVSEIRIPLLWKQDAHFKTKAGEQPALLYHVFCLLKINDQVFDTPLFQFNQIDTDVTFNDVFTFHNIQPDFKLEVEVYYSVIQNPDNPVWTPIRTPKKYVYNSAPKFCLAAHSQLTVDNVKDGFVVSDFTMGGIGASATAVLGQVEDFPDNPFSLWGQFSCQLHARPSCFLKEDFDGYLLWQSSNGGQPLWEKYYCRLRNAVLQFWKGNLGKEDCLSMTPTFTVPLKKNIKLRTETNIDNSSRCLLTLTTKGSQEKEPVLALENEEDFERWKKHLQQTIANIKAWKTENYTLINLEEFEAKKLAFNKVLNYFDQHNVESKQVSPGPARKATKSFLNMPDIAPKVKSFYEQIDIEEKADLPDGRTEPMDICQDKETLEVSTEEKAPSSENNVDTENGNSSVEKANASIVTNESSWGMNEAKDASDGGGGGGIMGESSLVSNVITEEDQSMPESIEAQVSRSSGGSLEDFEVVVDNEREAGGRESQGGEEDLKEYDESSQKIITASESAAAANAVDSTENPNSFLHCKEAEAETGRDDVGIYDSNEVHETDTGPDDSTIDIFDSNVVSKEEEMTNETEESVLDYFMETINFAAELDNEAPVSDGSSRESVVDENGAEDKLQLDLPENEIQDNVYEGCTDETTKPLESIAVCSTENDVGGDEGNVKKNVELNGENQDIVDESSVDFGTTEVDVDIKEVTEQDSQSSCPQCNELMEAEPMARPTVTENEEISPCNEPDVSVTTSNFSEAERCQDTTSLPEDDLEFIGDSLPLKEPPLTEPPSTELPSTEPPSIESPSTEPTSTVLPLVEPPSTDSHSIEPPSIEPPLIEPPSIELPSIEPPSIEPPSIEPPSIEPPSIEPPSIEPPSIEPPSPVTRDDTEVSDVDKVRSDCEEVDFMKRVCDDAEYSSEEGSKQIVVEQNIPTDTLSGEYNLSTVNCTDETSTKDDVTESVGVNRKIETDV